MKNKFLNSIKTLILVCFVSTSFLGYSQQLKNKKTTLGLLTFKALDVEKNYKEATDLTNTVKELFVESKKYVPLDRSNYAETAKYGELEAQKNIAFINGVVAKQGQQNGAIVLVGGELTSVVYNNLDKGVQCLITFTISISDVESGELLATEVFSPSKVETVIPKADGVDEITAFSSKMLQLRNKINNFIIANTPFYAKIIELEKDGKNTNILLEVGENEGVENGDQFAIYQIKKYGNKTRKLEVTTFGIDDVQGDFSIGSIKRKDVDSLQELINDEDVKLVCQQIECKFCPTRILK